MGEEKIKVAVDGQNKEMSITDVCELLNLSLEDLIKNKKDNSWEEVIRDTKPSCYINILGQLVISEEVIKRVNKQREKKAAMEKRILKASVLGTDNIEMKYDEYSDEIHVVYMKKHNDGEIRIPDYVDCVKLKAWNKWCDGCTIYIPAGCDIEMADSIFNIFDSERYEVDWGIAEHTKHIEVDSEHKTLASQDGVLYNKDMTELLAYPKYKEDYKYIIPDTVNCIVERAFCFPDNLKELEMRKGVAFDYGDLSGIQEIEIIEK